jgi:uncharacterized protein DUF4154
VALLSARAIDRTRRRAAHRWRAPLLAVLLCASAAQGQTQASEVSLKSAFLYKFIHYTEWPADALGEPGSPIALCVLGRDDVAQVLEAAVGGRISHERPVVVRRLADAAETPGCHLLFVGASDLPMIDQVLARVSGQPILTVGDADGFARRGGIINFTRTGARLGFEINRGAAQRAGLQLSSQLLKLSKLVPEESRGD